MSVAFPKPNDNNPPNFISKTLFPIAIALCVGYPGPFHYFINREYTADDFIEILCAKRVFWQYMCCIDNGQARTFRSGAAELDSEGTVNRANNLIENN
jgi:hypothetical protein